MTRYVIAFGRFWWDFIIGDDWRIAAGVVVALAIGATLVVRTGLSDTAVSLLTATCIFGAVAATVIGTVLAASKKDRSR